MMTSTIDEAIGYAQPGVCWVIVDPRSGDNGSVGALRAALARCSALSPIWRTASQRETGVQLGASAVAAKAGRVVVVGDDALIRAVASTLANTGVPLGLVPVGTGLDLARSIGVPTDPHQASAVALRGSRSVVDLMKVTIDGDRHTSSFVSVGIDSGAAGPGDSQRAGFAGVLRTGAARSSGGATATVGRQPPSYARSAAWVIGMGSRVSGARPATDRRLHLSMVRESRRFVLRGAGTGFRPAKPRVVTRDEAPSGHRVLLVLDEVTPCYLDGVPAGQATTVSAELQPDALTVLVPAGPLT